MKHYKPFSMPDLSDLLEKWINVSVPFDIEMNNGGYITAYWLKKNVMVHSGGMWDNSNN